VGSYRFRLFACSISYAGTGGGGVIDRERLRERAFRLDFRDTMGPPLFPFIGDEISSTPSDSGLSGR
jgi:hypothetical protein